MVHEIGVEDLIELNMAIENDRPIPDWTAKRIYPIIMKIMAGDMLKVVQLPEEEHYNG